MEWYLPWLEQGFERARKRGEDSGLHNFEIQASVHVEVSDNVSQALAKLKPEVAIRGRNEAPQQELPYEYDDKARLW